jgi:ApaG protein
MVGKTDYRIRIEPVAIYQEEMSRPAEDYYFFSYTITIKNDGVHTVQLLNRHWIIIDGTGHREDVRGPGVIGAQPVLQPGDSFSYTSACPLRVNKGTMRGAYEMVDEDGHRFQAKIPAFTLDRPIDVN